MWLWDYFLTNKKGATEKRLLFIFYMENYRTTFFFRISVILFLFIKNICVDLLLRNKIVAGSRNTATIRYALLQFHSRGTWRSRSRNSTRYKNTLEKVVPLGTCAYLSKNSRASFVEPMNAIRPSPIKTISWNISKSWELGWWIVQITVFPRTLVISCIISTNFCAE